LAIAIRKEDVAYLFLIGQIANRSKFANSITDGYELVSLLKLLHDFLFFR